MIVPLALLAGVGAVVAAAFRPGARAQHGERDEVVLHPGVSAEVGTFYASTDWNVWTADGWFIGHDRIANQWYGSPTLAVLPAGRSIADETVRGQNAQSIIRQWADKYGLRFRIDPSMTWDHSTLRHTEDDVA